MRLAANQYRWPKMAGEKRLDFFAMSIFSAGALMSGVIWALAIAKVIDLFGLSSLR